MLRRESSSKCTVLCMIYREDWKKFKEFEKQEAESDDVCEK